MESILHDDKTQTFAGDLDGITVFGASALGIERLVGTSAQESDVRTEVAQAPPIRRVSYEGVGLIMTSPTIHAPGAKPFNAFAH